jgi:hypothetical protein
MMTIGGDGNNNNDGIELNYTDDNNEQMNWGDLSVWDNAWAMVSYRTGITEPETFFERVEGRTTLENQMKSLKKLADTRLETLKQEIVDVELEMKESGYDASFAVVKGQDQSQKKRDLSTGQANLKYSKERTISFEKLRKDATEGLRHVADILGQEISQEQFDKININELIRDIEVAADVLLEEHQRVETVMTQGATQTSSQSQVLSPLNTERQMLMSGKENTDNLQLTRPPILNKAVQQIETFKPRVPLRLPSKFIDNINSRSKFNEDETLDRETAKNASLRIIKAERIKAAKKEKEAAEKLAKAMQD